MPETAAVGQQFQVQARWEVNPHAVPTVANQVMLRVAAGTGGTPNAVQLTFGFVNTPLPPPDATMEEMEHLTVPVVPVGDFFVPLDTAERLHAALTEMLKDLHSGDSSEH